MSKIGDLKVKGENNINLVNVLTLFTPECKSRTKYVETVTRLFHNDVRLNEKALLKGIAKLGLNSDDINHLSTIEKIYLNVIVSDDSNLKAFIKYKEFCMFSESNLLGNKDLQSYKKFQDVFKEYDVVKEKQKEKLLEKQVVKLLDDENWLVLKPLTYEASLKYGATTKWCTASLDNSSYFEQYTTDGALIYFMNKKSNTKFASHCKVKTYNNNKDITFWNAEDKQIDSMYCGFSPEVIAIIVDEFKTGDLSDKSVRTNSQIHADIKKDINKPLWDVKGKTKTKAPAVEPLPQIEEATVPEPVSDNGVAESLARELANDGPTNSDYTEIYNTIVNYMDRNRQ